MYQSGVRQSILNELKSNQTNLSFNQLKQNHNSSSFSSKKECMMYKNDLNKIQPESLFTTSKVNTLGNDFNYMIKKVGKSIKFSFKNIKNKLFKENIVNDFVIEYHSKQISDNQINLNTNQFLDINSTSNHNNLNISSELSNNISLEIDIKTSHTELINLELENNFKSGNSSSSLMCLDKIEEEDINKIDDRITNSISFNENKIKFDFNNDFDFSLKKNNINLRDELELAYMLEIQDEIKISHNNIKSFLNQTKNLNLKIQDLESQVENLNNNILILKHDYKILKENKLILESKLRPITTLLINLEYQEKYLLRTKNFINFNKLRLESKKLDLDNEIAIYESKILISLSEILLLEKNQRILKNEIRMLTNENELNYNNIPILNNNISFYKKNIKSCGLYLLQSNNNKIFNTKFISKTNIERLLYSALTRIKNELLNIDLLWIPY